MPAAQRRTRQIAPAEEPSNEIAVGPAPAKPKSQARRLQSATGDPGKRLPRGKRAVETVDGITAQMNGKAFKLQETIGLMPLMEWAAATDEVDPDNRVQLAGLYRLLADLVHADDWAAFRAHARETKADDEALVGFVNAAIEAIAARPTKEPATS